MQARGPGTLGSCGIAIITATYFTEGNQAALEKLQEMALALIPLFRQGNPRVYTFPEFSFLTGYTGKDRFPDWFRVFCDGQLYGPDLSMRYAPDPGRFLHVTHVLEAIVRVRNTYPQIFTDPAFRDLLLLEDGQELELADVENKILVLRPGTKARITGATLPINRNRYQNGTVGRMFNFIVCNQPVDAMIPALNNAEILRLYTNGIIPNHDSVQFWVIENGRPDPSSFTPIRLVASVKLDETVLDRELQDRGYYPSMPGRYYTRYSRFRNRMRKRYEKAAERVIDRATSTIVPACKACDSLLETCTRGLARSARRRNNNVSCPHCARPLEVYWRGAKAYRVELARFASGKSTGAADPHYYGRHCTLLALDDGVTKHVALDHHDLETIVSAIVSPHDTKHVKTDIVLTHGTPGEYHARYEPCNTTTAQATSSRVQALPPATSIPDRLIKVKRDLATRVAAAQAEIMAAAGEIERRKQEKRDKIEAIIGFWRDKGFSVELTGISKSLNTISLVVDGLYFKVPGRWKRGHGNHYIQLVNHLGSEVESFILRRAEVASFNRFLENGLATLLPGASMRVLEVNAGNQFVRPEGYARRLLHRRKKVLVCSNCNAIPSLQWSWPRFYAPNPPASGNCSFCGAPVQLVERDPAILHIPFEPAAPPQPGIGYSSWRSTQRFNRSRYSHIGARYHDQHIDIPLTPGTRRMLYEGVQHQFKNGMIDPLKLSLKYMMNKIVEPSFDGSHVVSFAVGTAPGSIEWRPAQELPEDKLAL
ncbi:MAG: hypothetical protein GYA24_06655 [Candidatus Lokiarchaeota archaeon]|nr:hypothetical protein [Candidatus Lokiarchaeota archaeon]